MTPDQHDKFIAAWRQEVALTDSFGRPAITDQLYADASEFAPASKLLPLQHLIGTLERRVLGRIMVRLDMQNWSVSEIADVWRAESFQVRRLINLGRQSVKLKWLVGRG